MQDSRKYVEIVVENFNLELFVIEINKYRRQILRIGLTYPAD